MEAGPEMEKIKHGNKKRSKPAFLFYHFYRGVWTKQTQIFQSKDGFLFRLDKERIILKTLLTPS